MCVCVHAPALEQALRGLGCVTGLLCEPVPACSVSIMVHLWLSAGRRAPAMTSSPSHIVWRLVLVYLCPHNSSGAGWE